jgi:hypothetical protein
MLLQREAYNARRDSLSYPPIPEAELFLNQSYGYEKPVKVHGWDWSVTFGRWSALVDFENGWHGWTFPKLPAN